MVFIIIKKLSIGNLRYVALVNTYPLNAITYAHLPPQQENYYIRVKKILSFH